MTPFTTLESTAVVLPLDDVDTDQIIPARFLQGTVKTGLGEHLFADCRRHPDFPLLAIGARTSGILIAGANFGCGSSREHAPWALLDRGFRAIVARSFADIFRQNALKNGLLPVALDDVSHARLVAAHAADPAIGLHIDLPAQQLAIAGSGAPVSFAIDPFAKHCLVHGVDELGYLLGFEDRITAHEAHDGRHH
ncbi:MAG TPA: 3-isopropylmalate dehydratase small subunit [Kofleriaceae bacterium]|jgi:3-isopropylmalate/(R)-2-methylmalate dehydratase small subunit|nr:3-isopropylmalate dehydratase small subunit [Kofleriaceae bacterium]